MGNDHHNAPTTAPRPALKHFPDMEYFLSNPLPFAFCSQMLDSPHVHFPPTPTMTSTELTHSSYVYDRTPIDVPTNTCALPKRGGRVYDGEGQAPPSRVRDASYFYLGRRSDDAQSFNEMYKYCDTPPSDDSAFYASQPQMSILFPSDSPAMWYGATSSDDKQTPEPCPPSLAKKKHGKKSRKRGDSAGRMNMPFGAGMSKPSCARIRVLSDCSSAFNQPSLDGCLGGF